MHREVGLLFLPNPEAMKKRFIVLATSVLLIVLSLSTCDTTKEIPPTEVNPAFEMAPPIAEQITLQLLKEPINDGNVLLVADFGARRMEVQYHAIQLSTGKVVLRDDGSGGDEKASDNKFSIVLKEETASITTELEQMQSRAKEFRANDPFDFVARHKVKMIDRDLGQINIEDWQAGRPVLLPRRLLCFLNLNVSIPHSLLVTNLGTVEDDQRIVHPCNNNGTANGAWTFERLMTDMANPSLTGISAEDFVKDWLDTWLKPAIVNEEPVDPRKEEMFDKVIKPWVIRSGSNASQFTIDTWRTRSLNLSKAPFKLIAIVNRLDLHGNMGYGTVNAGEGRFVFEVLNESCAPLPAGFTVIFEYGLPLKNCAQINDYAQKWYDLKNIPQGLGSAEYNNALQSITDVFATANASPERPNGSAINQIRTNERAIGRPWELREFNVDRETHKLFLTTVKQEPAKKYNEAAFGQPADVAKLVAWINSNSADILQNTHTVPLTIPDNGTDVAFLGGKSHSEPGLWTGTGILDNEVRHHFSFNTCAGCHRAETSTTFLHLSTVSFAQESVPSGFLTGVTAPDPNGSGVDHSFGDLEDRRRKLADLLCTSCTGTFLELTNALIHLPHRIPH